MCPPASSIPLCPENDEHLTDEGILMSLLNFKNGSLPPPNVTCDVNPYRYRPSDLPADLWYFCSGVKKDTECGFWHETGEPCVIFSNSTILGSRTTLQFYEGQAPHGRKTDWLMQEYRMNENCKNDVKDQRALCRVFLADESRPLSRDYIANNDVKISINFDPRSSLNMKSELLEKSMNNGTRSPNPFLENSSEMDCILNGDYFELNDLIDPSSHSSSSANSSCLSMTSNEYFDSIALLHELEHTITDQETKDSSIKFNLYAPIKSEVVICPPTSVILNNDEECNPSGTINGVNITTSSSSFEGTSMEGKECVSRKKRRKMVKYLCFLAF